MLAPGYPGQVKQMTIATPANDHHVHKHKPARARAVLPQQESRAGSPNALRLKMGD
jgi:hypothetical protein